MKRLAAALLAAILLLTACGAALADIQRGDRGEDVRELQKLLQECGWLFEEPDGIFGRHTETALKEYQEYAGFEANGVADDELIAQLKKDWEHLHGRPYGSPAPDPNVKVKRESCSTSLRFGMPGAEFCEEHAALLGGEDAGATCLVWEAAAHELYAEWLRGAPAEDKLCVAAAYGAWQAALIAQDEALSAVYAENPALADEWFAGMLRNQTIALCGISAERRVAQ